MAAEVLGINYKYYSPEYVHTFEETPHNDAKSWAHISVHKWTSQLVDKYWRLLAAVIKELRTNNYISADYDESLSRTILDLILVGRLRHLEDEDAHKNLLLLAEVPVSVNSRNKLGKHEVIKGRADWVLGYGMTRQIQDQC